MLRYRQLAHTGLKLSEVSLGSWATIGDRVGRDEGREILLSAYESGINHFDTAEIYAAGRAEATLGETLEALGWQRETFVVTTKIMWGTGGKAPNTWGLSRKHLIEGCQASLKRLRLDHVDFLLCHRPDLDTPIEETVGAIGHLLARGCILYWGISEWPTARIEEAFRLSDACNVRRPVVEQSQYNLFERRRVEVDLSESCMAGIGVCTWSPLLYGLLAGRRVGSRVDREDMGWLREIALPEHEENLRIAVIEAFEAVAKQLGVSPGVAALSWCLAQKRVCSVITGASTAAQLQNNLKELAQIRDFSAIRKQVDSGIETRGFQFSIEANRFLKI